MQKFSSFISKDIVTQSADAHMCINVKARTKEQEKKKPRVSEGGGDQDQCQQLHEDSAIPSGLCGRVADRVAELGAVGVAVGGGGRLHVAAQLAVVGERVGVASLALAVVRARRHAVQVGRGRAAPLVARRRRPGG